MKKVLIVDDDELIRSLVKLHLTGLGNFEFWEANNGQGALDLARHLTPDLLIVDLTMPVMDGIQLTIEIRKEEALKVVPIIVVTGAGEELKTASYKAGANIVLEKPLYRKLMKAAIEKLLPKPK